MPLAGLLGIVAASVHWSLLLAKVLAALSQELFSHVEGQAGGKPWSLGNWEVVSVQECNLAGKKDTLVDML